MVVFFKSIFKQPLLLLFFFFNGDLTAENDSKYDTTLS